MNKRGISKWLKIIIIVIVVSLLIIGVWFFFIKKGEIEEPIEKGLVDKLKGYGYSQEEADKIADKYRVEKEVEEAIKEAREKKEEFILDDISVKNFPRESIILKTITGLLNKASTFLVGIEIKEIPSVIWSKTKNLLGFYTFWGSVWNFLKKFFVGVIAGLLIWAGNIVANKINTKRRNSRTTPIVTWLNSIAGKIEKILIIGIIYATLMQIALFNRFIEIITFYHFTPLWLRPVMLAIIIGYFPAMVEFLIKIRTYQKTERKINQIKAGVAVSRALGRP